MKCWFCDEEAPGRARRAVAACAVIMRIFHDEMTLAKSDTSTGYTSYYNVYGALKCEACRLEWKNFVPR